MTFLPKKCILDYITDKKEDKKVQLMKMHEQ